MSDLDLAAIKARCAAATREPWNVIHFDEESVVAATRMGHHLLRVVHPAYAADGEFCAHARTDVPALVAEVERLREELDDQASLVEVFEDEAKRLRSELAECYRITGADPDGDDDAMLARKAVAAVKRLREESDTEAEAAEAEIVRLRAIEAEAKTYLANMDYCFTAENLTVEDEGHRDASESRLRALLAKGGAA